MIKNLFPIWTIIFYVFLCNIIIVFALLYYIDTLNFFYFVYYFFICSIESIDCIHLSSLALNEILYTSAVNTSSFLLLNLCCDFNINLLIFMIFSETCYINYFFLVGLLYFQPELLLNKFYSLQI